jgi:hypothetical protein
MFEEFLHFYLFYKIGSKTSFLGRKLHFSGKMRDISQNILAVKERCDWMKSVDLGPSFCVCDCEVSIRGGSTVKISIFSCQSGS